jgi:hypothetical protein
MQQLFCILQKEKKKKKNSIKVACFPNIYCHKSFQDSILSGISVAPTMLLLLTVGN